jgi:predicted  nucleic acid-binding Zn-ribbon protein
MNWILWVYAISALASALAAVLAWAAKLWWAKEYSAAKDEIIKAKDAQIETLKNEIQNLRELTPMKIREYFLSVKEQLEEYNDKLQGELKTAYEEIEKKDSEISQLHKTYPGMLPGGGELSIDFRAAKLESRVQHLMATKEQLQIKANSLKQKLQKEEERRQNFKHLLSWLDQAQVDEVPPNNETKS